MTRVLFRPVTGRSSPTLFPPVRLRPRCRALVLLCGAVRATAWHDAIGRSLLDLPLDDRHTVLDAWCAQVTHLGRWLMSGRPTVRVVVAGNLPLPRPGQRSGVELSIERDPAELRGTAGVLRDITEEYDEEDYVLCAPAGQVLLAPLGELARALQGAGADVAAICHQDASPSSLMLLKRQCLAMVPRSGFHDLKEQAMPAMAAHYRVRVVAWPQSPALSLRSPSDYIRSLRRHHLHQSGLDSVAGAFAETWQAAFSIVEPEAAVAASARMLDSVVLAAARVEAGATVVRSVVCPGGVVARNQTVVDQLVTSTGAVPN